MQFLQLLLYLNRENLSQYGVYGFKEKLLSSESSKYADFLLTQKTPEKTGPPFNEWKEWLESIDTLGHIPSTCCFEYPKFQQKTFKINQIHRLLKGGQAEIHFRFAVWVCITTYLNIFAMTYSWHDHTTCKTVWYATDKSEECSKICITARCP